MVNTNPGPRLMYYWNPKRIAELKAKGLKLRAAPEMLIKASQEKEAISPDPATAESGRALEATSDKPQASSSKPQAATINRINKKEKNE